MIYILNIFILEIRKEIIIIIFLFYYFIISILTISFFFKMMPYSNKPTCDFLLLLPPLLNKLNLLLFVLPVGVKGN